MEPNIVGPSIFDSTNYVVLDFEIDTSHGDYGHAVHQKNGVLLGCWKEGPNGIMQSCWGDEFNQDRLLRACQSADFIVAHNAKYELGWLKRIGIDLSAVTVYDTKIAEYVLLGNLAAGCNATGLAGRSTSLDACCLRRGWMNKDPMPDLMMKYGMNPVLIPRPWLRGRCVQDVLTTERLFQDQRRLLADTGRMSVVYTRCLLTPVLAAMEFEGMFLDKMRVEKVYEEHVRELNRLEREFDEECGGINWRSAVQVGEFLYSPEPEGLGFEELRGRDGKPKRTAKDRPKTDKATIAALKPRTPRQKRFVSLRSRVGKVGAALSKSLEFFYGICQEYGCQFHAEFNQTKTATHRLSSSGFKTWIEEFQGYKTTQFQNMPRQFKPLFRSRNPAHVMVEIDGSQLEFRVAADLGRDKQAYADITDPDFDAHCLTASVIFGWEYDEILEAYRNEKHPRHKDAKADRTAAKAHTFKPLYGGQSGTKAEKAYYSYFNERYRGLADAQEGWLEKVLMDKRLITPWGMRYYWPRAKRGKDGYANVKTNVYNYPIQAFATAEIIPIALYCLWQRLRGRDGIRFVNTVHDSVILEADPTQLDAIREAAILAFGSDVYEYLRNIYQYKFRVPLGCGMTVGTHWSEGAEESYNIWPTGKVERIT